MSLKIKNKMIFENYLDAGGLDKAQNDSSHRVAYFVKLAGIQKSPHIGAKLVVEHLWLILFLFVGESSKI